MGETLRYFALVLLAQFEARVYAQTETAPAF